MAELIPLALKDAPSLIESVFPAQKVSFEAQKERKSVSAQTLTRLGSYWKGRKPLILVRAIILGILLPTTCNTQKDLEVFERLMAFDDESLAKRALAANAFSATRIQEIISIKEPEYYFSGNSWRRTISEEEKLDLYRQALATFTSYEEKSNLGRRPEEIDQDWLYTSVWGFVNKHYAHLGVNAQSITELVEQLGVLRYGHRPRVGDTFSGGGSIPFEAARVGCDVYASDLNPVACMLTWGAFNLVGAPAESRVQIESDYREALESVKRKITELGVEKDKEGNVVKAFLYCTEARCPQTGWLIPLSTSWVISPRQGVIAKLVPNEKNKKFDIHVLVGVSKSEIKEATVGTIQGQYVVYTLNGKTYKTSVSTLRGDFKRGDGTTGNKLRHWGKSDFRAKIEDCYQERLYAIQWIAKDSLELSRQNTYFKAPTTEDLEREGIVDSIVQENMLGWQSKGLLSDMPIESGYNTEQPIRERGWTHWHHLFTARHILINVLFAEELKKRPETCLWLPNILDNNNKLCQWLPSQGGGLGGPKHLFFDQTLSTFWNFTVRASSSYETLILRSREERLTEIKTNKEIINLPAASINYSADIFVTDPPYADAVNYHEITEFFIAWLRKNPPKPFDEWVWDSRRALAIKGSGEGFRHEMVNAYKNMANHMPENGMQCVMFTHQDTNVWADMVGIFWAAGLQVMSAWYIATEVDAAHRSGLYVQGTVILMLRKRPEGEKAGFKQRLLPAVRAEVQNQIKTMMHLNEEVADKMGEPVFNDSDLQMAGYAAALKVLTAYTHIGGEDVTNFALRPRTKGEETVVDEIVDQAAEAANSLLVPEGLSKETWQKINGIQRFYMRMMDIETTGASKLDNYQNFAKAFRVDEYSQIMQSMAANKSRLKRIPEFSSRDLSDSTEIGATWLGSLVIGLQQLLQDIEPKVVVEQLMQDLPDFLEVRTTLIDILAFIEHKAPDEETRNVAEILAARLRNMRALGQD